MWIALLLNVLAALYAAFSLRPLFTEGVHWLYVILDTGRPFVDWQYQRYADILPQVASVAIVRWFPDFVSTQLPTLFFCFAYAFQPLLLLLISMAILISKKRKDLIPLCLLSFALASQTVAPAAQMIVPQTLGLFWITFFLLLFLKNSWGQTFLTMFFMVALALTHEVSIFCFLILALVSLRQMAQNGIKSRFGVLLFLNLILSAWIADRVLGPQAGRNNLFVQALFRPWDAFRWYTVLSAILITAGLLLGTFLKTRIIYILGILVLLLTVVSVTTDGRLSSGGELSLWNANFARTTAVPVALLFALTALWLDVRGGAPPRAFLKFCAALTLVAAAAHDYRLTRHWSTGLKSLETYVNEAPAGCHLLKDSGEINFWSSHDLALDRLSLFSVILQFNKHPKKILFAENLTGADSCQTLRASGLVKNGWEAFRMSPSDVNSIFGLKVE